MIVWAVNRLRFGRLAHHLYSLSPTILNMAELPPSQLSNPSDYVDSNCVMGFPGLQGGFDNVVRHARPAKLKSNGCGGESVDHFGPRQRSGDQPELTGQTA